ncbi:MAG: signal peptidase II [Chloroflexi bacterium HGW-Chloroflexi-2]|nr:MAG: signal peptidase II [Chloroflexi bacterium HGW-Chloroflexi-2]
MKKLLRTYSLLIVTAIVIISLDQYTKYLVRQNLDLWTETWVPWDWMLPYVRIVHVQNTGVAFGMFQGFGDIFSIVAIIVALIIVFYFPRVPASDWSLRLAMSLQLSGALGNLIDRLTIGHVTDFVSVGNFPVWNIADASITIGVVVLILGVWITEIEEKKKKVTNQESQVESDTDLMENV